MTAPGTIEQKTLIEEAHFSVEARLAIQLGRESISSSVTAVLELVKNAYDADAARVKIRFKEPSGPSALMVIEDDGDGMTVDDLRSFWMVIGTSNKVKARKSSKNRVLTGEKGLGRLGLDRLSKTTVLRSIVSGATQGLELFIDWAKYETDNTLLESVSHQVYSISNIWTDPITGQQIEYSKGTRFTLQGLKDDWNENTLAELRAELSLLVSPFETGQDFSIELTSDLGLVAVDGPVRTPTSLLAAAQWKVVSSVDDAGQVHMRMDSGRHSRVYEAGPVPWAKRFPALGSDPCCGSLRFEFYFFPRKAVKLNGDTFSLTTVRNFLDSNQGIRIYRDGFRVKPYGSPNGDGDWLRLAYRRMTSPEGVAQDIKPGAWRVGYNQVVGAVFVTRENNSGLLDQTNREGLVEGKALAHLRVLADATVRFFELNHQDYEMGLSHGPTPREEARAQAGESVRATEKAIETLGTLLKELRIDHPSHAPDERTDKAESVTNAAIEEIQKDLNEAKEKIAQSLKNFQAEDEREAAEKDTLANLASLGILAAAFGHETLGWASSCSTNAGWLERNLPKYFFFPAEETRKTVLNKLIDTRTMARRIETFAAFSIGNVKPEKRRRKVFCLKSIVQDVFKAFDETLKIQRSIKLDIAPNLPPGRCYITGYPIDWESVLVNLITNAVWAIDRRQGERIIRVALRPHQDSYLLEFDDSGIGIEAGDEERIFLPTFSTKRNDRGESNGTGMGLTIVKNFVEQNTGGSIKAKASGLLGGASFVILVPAAKGHEE